MRGVTPVSLDDKVFEERENGLYCLLFLHLSIYWIWNIFKISLIIMIVNKISNYHKFGSNWSIDINFLESNLSHFF